MKTLRTILIVIVALIALLLIIALFTKKDYSVQREVVINKPKELVFDYVRLTANQNTGISCSLEQQGGGPGRTGNYGHYRG
jgi:cell division protein FtsL